MLQGKVSISRFQANYEPFNGIALTLTDEASGKQILRIEFTPEQFGNAVSGLSYQECNFELFDLAMVGKTRVYKEESVWLPEYPNFAEVQEKVLALEVDGWKTTFSKNTRVDPVRKDDGYIVNVSFVRYE